MGGVVPDRVGIVAGKGAKKTQNDVGARGRERKKGVLEGTISHFSDTEKKRTVKLSSRETETGKVGAEAQSLNHFRRENRGAKKRYPFQRISPKTNRGGREKKTSRTVASMTKSAKVRLF